MKIQEYLVSTYIDPSKNENLPKIPNEQDFDLTRILEESTPATAKHSNTTS